jgi:adenine-specific DNA-methyltransferase
LLDGEFIYFELDKYNQKYIDKLNAIKQGHGTAKTIEQLYDEITKHAFLNYDVESPALFFTNPATIKVQTF